MQFIYHITELYNKHKLEEVSDENTLNYVIEMFTDNTQIKKIIYKLE